VDRTGSNSQVSASAAALRAADGPVQLVVPPEGTRGKTRHWKTGFYYIALEAGVPIILAYMDYSTKVSGLGPIFVPTGDVQADMLEIKRFYAGIQGRRPHQFQAD
jgi:1-acyl-sn-glycerol-3-phosphate acyltransferase